MASTVKSIPDGYSSVTPYLSVKDAKAASDFYARALGAREVYRMEMPDGRIGHAELQIGSSRIMLADETPGMADAVNASPRTLHGTTVAFMIYLDDVDARFAQAIAAGGVVKRPVDDKFYGDRSGTFEDPYGHIWTLATHIEDVPPDEMQRRMDAMMKTGG